jgi:hypothetical protein
VVDCVNVVSLDTPFYGDIPADQVLEKAKGELKDVLVIGRMNDGEIYAACSMGDVAHTLLLLDIGRDYLFSMVKGDA